MNHAEEPALSRIIDDGARQELSSRGNCHVAGLPDQRIDIVGHDFVIEQLTNRSAQPQLEVILDLVIAGAKTGTPQQVLDDMLAVPYPVPLGGIATRLMHRSLTPGANHTPVQQGMRHTTAV